MFPKERHSVLVTGGAGFIGSNFIKSLLQESPKSEVICLDVLTYAGNKDNLKGLPKERFSFVKGDITDRKGVVRLLKKYQPEYIINFAAESHVDRSIHLGASDFITTNVLGTVELLEAIREVNLSIKKYVQVSTDEVYGSLALSAKKLFTEETPVEPNSPYAASKAAADLLVHAFYKTHGIPAVITRCSNNYGPYQYPEKLIPFSITRLLEGKPLTIYGDGKNVRDWIHVEDHCGALMRVLFSGLPGEVYNIGADEEVSNLAVANRLLKFFEKDHSSLTFVKDRPGHDLRYAIDASKVRRTLGWKPKHTMKNSFDDVVQWYVDNPLWIKRALDHSGAANTHI